LKLISIIELKNTVLSLKNYLSGYLIVELKIARYMNKRLNDGFKVVTPRFIKRAMQRVQDLIYGCGLKPG